MDRSSPFIITITGPSQSGKSLLVNKIIKNATSAPLGEKGFIPERIKKYATRETRVEERKSANLDVISVAAIPDACDLVYQTYGERYGLQTETLRTRLTEGKSPIVIMNDIRSVEELKRWFPGQVLALFIFRKVPEIEDYIDEAKKRGNVSETEVYARYEKAIAIYRTFIENIALFDKVILNAQEYSARKLRTTATLMDEQIRNVICGVLDGDVCLSENGEQKGKTRLFIIAGNAASGKDEMVRGIMAMGKLQAEVLTKFASRAQEENDGAEMICRKKPCARKVAALAMEHERDKNAFKKAIADIPKTIEKNYRTTIENAAMMLSCENKTGLERFWSRINEKSRSAKGITEHSGAMIAEHFELNPEYVDLQQITQEGKLLDAEDDSWIYQWHDAEYLIYGASEKLYGCEITNIQQKLGKSSYDHKHVVLVASSIGVVNL